MNTSVSEKKHKIVASYPLTPMQSGILFHALTSDDPALYLIQLKIDVAEALDFELLREALSALLRKYEALRTSFVFKGVKEPAQVVLQQRPLEFTRYELNSVVEEQLEDVMEELLRQDRERGFDLTKSTLIRAMLISINSTRSVLAIAVHHMIFDGWSREILINELKAKYYSLKAGHALADGDTCGNNNYLRWLARQPKASAQDFWRDYLKGADALTTVALDTADVTGEPKVENVAVELRYIDTAVSTRLSQLALKNGVTLSSVMEVAWAWLLSRYNDTQEVIFGTVQSGRTADVEGLSDAVGLFLMTLPKRICFNAESHFLEVCRRNQIDSIRCEKSGYLTLPDIQACSSELDRLFDHIVLYQNYRSENPANDNWGKTQEITKTHYPFNLIITPGPAIEIMVAFDIRRVPTWWCEQLLASYTCLLNGLAESFDVFLHELEIHDAAAKLRLCSEFPCGESVPIAHEHALSMFESVVNGNSGSPAVSMGSVSLSYRELNRRANRLAHYLIAEGVQQGEAVGVAADKSIETPVALLAIIKIGAAYVPICPTWPAERLAQIVEATQMPTLLLQTALKETVNYGGKAPKILNISDYAVSGRIRAGEGENEREITLADISDNNPACKLLPSDVAYIIFTSGTTGKPKGVLNTHRNLVNLCQYLGRSHYHSGTRVLQAAPFYFDGSVMDIWGSLLCGAQMYIPDAIDPQIIAHDLARWRIESLLISPSFLKMMLPVLANNSEICATVSESLKRLISGGEALETAVVDEVRSLLSDISIHNIYGPTETTVFSTEFLVPENYCSSDGVVTIGKPIANVQCYILDQQRALSPIGVEGELYIAGAGLASGYLGDLEKSAASFIEVQKLGLRAYKTGDRCRWNRDGTIAISGRADDQVKLRGYRIELGEVTAAVASAPRVQDAVVMVQIVAGKKELCAYLTGESLSLAELRRHVGVRVPDYMIPSHFIVLDSFPLTDNKKVDKKALPVPEPLDPNAEFIMPRNDQESLLAKVWGDVLKLEAVGITSNFFALGGDSIKAIQVASRLQKFNYELKVSDLFVAPTIEELVHYLREADGKIDQSSIYGRIGFSPVQSWFLGQRLARENHFNQACKLESDSPLDANAARQALNRVVKHHDMLRARMSEDRASLQVASADNFSLDLQVQNAAKDQIEETVITMANELHISFDLQRGPLLAAALIQSESHSVLLLVAHHLIVDGVSWRIIAEDFEQSYRACLAGEKVTLANKTLDYKRWVEFIDKEFVVHESAAQYWKTISASGPIRLPGTARPFALTNVAVEQFGFSTRETQVLQQSIHRAYNTNLQDILLAALAITCKRQFGGNGKILLESHGRQGSDQLPNVNRTVGWFTIQYPFVLEAADSSDISDQISAIIISTKERLRKVADKGFSYSVMAHREQLPEGTAAAEIGFNFLGELHSDRDAQFRLGFSGTGTWVSSDNRALLPFEVIGIISGGELRLQVHYNNHRLSAAQVAQFTTDYKSAIQMLADHCTRQTQTQPTPSDFVKDDLSLQDLERIAEHNSGYHNIEDILPLAPLQSGMLYFKLINPDSNAYIIQYRADIQGELDTNLLRRAWQQVVQRHDALRLQILHTQLDAPAQLVLKRREEEFNVLDWTTRTDGDTAFQNFMAADLARGFDFEADHLIRINIVKMAADRYAALFSVHHIILDGWCISLLVQDWLSFYQQLKSDTPPQLSPITPYKRYIQWLAGRNQNAAKNFWCNYLEGYESTRIMPFVTAAQDYKNGGTKYMLDADLSARLTHLARKTGVTLNSVFQALWAILLKRYNNIDEVVFGCTISGRNIDLPNIDTVVGLLINTIPVRIKIDEEAEFSGFVKQVQDNFRRCEQQSTLNLADIQACSSVKDELLDHVLIFENYPGEEKIQGPGFDIRLRSEDVFDETNYVFNLVVIPGKHIEILCSFNTLAFAPGKPEEILSKLAYLAEQVSTNECIPIEKLNVLDEMERARILAFNPPPVPFYNGSTMAELFNAQVQRTPDAVAVISGSSDGDLSVTYKELGELSNRLSQFMIAQGVQPNDNIGVVSDKAIETLVAILAAQKASAVYVPVYSGWPQKRMHEVATEADIKMLFFKNRNPLPSETTQLLRSFDVEHVRLGLLAENSRPIKLDEYPNRCPPVQVKPQDTSYIMFTSGTTGKPKGIENTHLNVAHLSAYCGKKHYWQGRGVIQYPAWHFDACIMDLWVPLLRGCCVYLTDMTPGDIIRLLVQYDCHELLISPSALREIIGALTPETAKKIRCLEKVTSGGEPLDYLLLNKARALLGEHVAFTNIYGPTETTVFCTDFPVQNFDVGKTIVEIGAPIDNMNAYVLDNNRDLCPIGVTGEIYMSGAGIAKGYFKNPELTNASFLRSPFDGQVLYKTGDRGRWNADGQIEIVGRTDNQVKVRGYRVEIGEVRAAILACAGVREAGVIVKKVGTQNVLAAFVEAEQGMTAAQIRGALYKVLPEYMIPAHVVLVDVMPCTPNHKIDQNKLREWAANLDEQHDAETNVLTPSELALSVIWQSVLHVDRIKPDDNFFALGGNSLKGIEVVSRLKRATGTPVDISSIFVYPTLREYAQHLEEIGNAKQAVTHISDVEQIKTLCLECAQAMVSSPDQVQIKLIQIDDPLRTQPLRGALVLCAAEDVERFDRAEFARVLFARGALVHRVKLLSDLDTWKRAADVDFFELFSEFPSESIALQLDRIRTCFKYPECEIDVISSQRYPLSPRQTLIVNQYGLQHLAQNYGDLRLNLAMEPGTLLSVFNRLIARHPMLRTVVAEDGTGAGYELLEYQNCTVLSLPYADLSSLAPEQQDATVTALIRELGQSFDLRQWPLHRIMLLKESEASFRLIWTFCHFSADGENGKLVIKELKSLLDAEFVGQSVNLPALHESHRNYSEFLRASFARTDTAAEKRRLAAWLDEAQIVRARMQPLCVHQYEMNFYNYDISTNGFDLGIPGADTLDYIYSAFCLAVAEWLEIDIIPVGNMYHGRIYGDRNFFNLAADCHDRVPVRVALAGNSREDLVRQVVAIRTSDEHTRVNYFTVAEALSSDSPERLKSLMNIPFFWDFKELLSYVDRDSTNARYEILPKENDLGGEGIYTGLCGLYVSKFAGDDQYNVVLTSQHLQAQALDELRLRLERHWFDLTGAVLAKNDNLFTF